MLIFYIQLNKEDFHKILRACDLIVKLAKCPNCYSNLELCEYQQLLDKYFWPCRKKSARIVCYVSKSFQVNSWLTLSKLTMKEILKLTFDNLKVVPAIDLIEEYSFSSATAANRMQHIRKVLVDYIELCSEKLQNSEISPEKL